MKLYLDEYSTCLRIHAWGVSVDVVEGAFAFLLLALFSLLRHPSNDKSLTDPITRHSNDDN
jgi:hypothetical protein